MEYSNLRRIYTSKTVEYQVRILEIFTFLFLLPSSQFDWYGNSARMVQAVADVAKRDSLGSDVNDSHTQKSCQWKWRYWQDERSKPGLWLQFRQTFLTEGEYMWSGDWRSAKIFMRSWPTKASLVAQMVKGSACNASDPGSITGLGRSPREGNGSNILARRIPWTEEPGRLQYIGVARVGHDLATKPPKQTCLNN